MNLRPYQIETIDRVRIGWTDWRKQLVVLPTGAGKTIVAANVAKEFVDAGQRVLFLAHREELLTQTLDKFQRAVGLFAQLEKAEHRASLESKVVVGSIQTFTARGDRWPVDHFGLVIVDEAHHVLADSYLSTVGRFNAKVMGITASSDRTDNRNLGQFFENIAHEVSLLDLINQGYLSRILIKGIPLKIDLSDVKISKGDYDATELGSAIEPYLAAIADKIKTEAAGRRTLVFCPLRVTSQLFVQKCQEIGITARHVDGESKDRDEIRQDFAAGKLELVSNAMLWTEGFDDPGIDCISVLRPTKSRPLFAQMCGRGLRIAPQKRNLLLLDFLWLSQKHNLVRPANLVASTEEIAETMTQLSFEKGGESDLEDLASTAREKREEKLRRELESKSRKNAFSCDAMEFCLSVGSLATADWEDVMDWQRAEATEKQLALIRGAGIAPSSIQSKGHASAVIDLILSRRRLNLASPKQVKLMKKLGHPRPETLSKDEAGKFISTKLRRGSREEVAA